MHIGLYFGSFNPVHIGHLIIASYAKHTTDLKQVWLVLSPQNPLKQTSTLLNEYDRLHLLNLAIQDDIYLKASDVEFSLPKPSYTIDTLRHLKQKYPMHKFSIIMGTDSLQNLENWKNHNEIIQNHKIYAFVRPGFSPKKYDGADIQIIDAPLLEISSTVIRTLIKNKVPIRYMVPANVAKEIEICRHYL